MRRKRTTLMQKHLSYLLKSINFYSRNDHQHRSSMKKKTINSNGLSSVESPLNISRIVICERRFLLFHDFSIFDSVSNRARSIRRGKTRRGKPHRRSLDVCMYKDVNMRLRRPRPSGRRSGVQAQDARSCSDSRTHNPRLRPARCTPRRTFVRVGCALGIIRFAIHNQ